MSRTPSSRRTLILVAGSGRSGTSLFSGILQRLGYHVPQPEVPADATNPRGFAESQWVVDFHGSLLRAARVQVSDARPAAWALTGRAAFDEAVRHELREWLTLQFERADGLVIKDPRLSWYLSLWRASAGELGVPARFVTMLRHPGAVINSKQRWYGAWQGDVARAAGWVQQTLFTERATRDSPRAFVRYEDLLGDWPRVLAGVGEELDLGLVRDAPVQRIRDVHAFVDRSLSRARADWDDIDLPVALRELADEVWSAVSELATDPAHDPARFDALRAAYVQLYAQAEAVAQSSIAAARALPTAAAAPSPAPALRLVRRMPTRYRHSVPLDWRIRIARLLT